MDLFKAALVAGQKLYNMNGGGFNNEQKLREQLYSCTYNDDTKFIIEKAVRQVFHVYTYFQTQILSFKQNGVEKRFLEIKGILEVDVRGKTCKVDYNLMLPHAFPRKPPYVRIINRNDYLVDPHYKNLRSPTDAKSYILNEILTEAKKWNQHSSIVQIIIESNKVMRENFPFFKPVKQDQGSVSQGWANINQKINGDQWGASQITSNQGYGSQGINSQGFSSQGFNNPGFNSQPFKNQGYSQGYGNSGFKNQGFGFVNPTSQGFNNFGGNPVPPIPFQNNTVNVGQAIANSQKFVGQSKKIMQKMKVEHIKAVEKIQNLEVIKISVDSEQEYLRNENQKMSEFLRRNEKSDVGNLTDLIRPKDSRSDQILNLLSSIKAKEDCLVFLEGKFSDSELSFDEFIKLVKKIEEQKFDDRAIMIKCIEG